MDDETRQDMEDQIGPSLAALIKTEEQARAVSTVFVIINNDHITRAWLVGMNDNFGDKSPLTMITEGNHDSVIAEAKRWAQY